MPKRSHHNYTVYILTNKPNGTLNIGVTGGLDNRMERHIKKHKINFKI
jgi:putative endonuclease